MLRYVDTKVVFRELPDEITLAINLSGCPCHCAGCHSPYLADDVGEELTCEALYGLVRKNPGITAVSFMGGDGCPADVNAFAEYLRYEFPDLKIGWYSGRDELNELIDLQYFDYVKIGRYDARYGALDKQTTNQRMYKVWHEDVKSTLIDITDKFWKRMSV